MKELKQYWTSKNGNRQTTNFIVIHHAAATYAKGNAVQAIYNYHRSIWASYNAAGYHVICQEETDGSIQCYLVNPPDMQGAGVAFRNHETFHICLATNFVKYPEKRWIDAAREVYLWARVRYPNARLVGHKDIAMPNSPTACPGASWPLWKRELETVTKAYPIIGGRTEPIAVLNHHLFTKAKHLNAGQRQFIVSAFTTYGEVTEIGNVFPFAQAALETGWFTSDRFLKSNNPAGLGATDDGAWGNEFDTISAGILAQYAHLLCYAKPEQDLKYIQRQLSMLSPWREAMMRVYGLGAANNTWKGLTRKWATDPNYDAKIVSIAESIV